MMLQLFKKGLEVCAAMLAECPDQKKSTEEPLQPTHKFICIGCDFSKTPNEGLKLFGGEESGEEFRNQILTPSLLNLSKGQKLIIRLDHISDHYSCRFLYESFGELVKRNGFSPKYLSKKIEFQYEKHDFALYEKKIWRYILED